jgi:hypothetical protein
MNKSTFRSPTILLASLLLLFCSCSKINFFYEKPTDTIRFALLRITNQYFQNIDSGNLIKTTNMILAEQYFSTKGNNFTGNDFQKQFDYIQKRWTLSEHPFLGSMDFVDAGILTNEAYVIVRKKENNGQTYPKIRVDFVWVGTGWLISNDSIFGPKGIVAGLMSENN